jgi:octaheme c-type cytochrome (tetrathionate reductase family)
MSCHGTKEHQDIMATSHWTWKHDDPATGQHLGKKNIINNFCIATASNEPRCTSCHIGTGWKDNSFDFNDPSKVDCLVCHDTTGTYKKPPTTAGMPDPTLDLAAIARKVGKTSRKTCGACHFFGGGADAVKHGDIDSSLTNPTRLTDVHMGTDGGDFTCSQCHTEESTPDNHHDFHGTTYPTAKLDHELCQTCHSAPHAASAMGSRLDAHTAKVACQACHIPAFARGTTAGTARYTKMWWDWTTAGNRLPDGKQRVVKDANGNTIYDSMKGTFEWRKNLIPDYRWFNGEVTYVTLDTPVVAGTTLAINRLGGGLADPKARLYPVKRFTGKQYYDLNTGKLVVPHLFATSPTDNEAYWKTYDWDRAITTGQAAVGRTYSGQRGIVDTEMFWIQNHMVAPKEAALGCAECHSPGGRIDFAALGYPPEQAAELQGFYPPDTVLLEAAKPGTAMTLRWSTEVTYFIYQVQSSSDLVHWRDEPTGRFEGGSSPQSFAWTDPLTDGAPPAKYYRVLRSAQ